MVFTPKHPLNVGVDQFPDPFLAIEGIDQEAELAEPPIPPVRLCVRGSRATRGSWKGKREGKRQGIWKGKRWKGERESRWTMKVWQLPEDRARFKDLYT